MALELVVRAGRVGYVEKLCLCMGNGIRDNCSLEIAAEALMVLNEKYIY